MVTEREVDAAFKAYQTASPFSAPDKISQGHARDLIRIILEAAAAAQAEPEIPVTERQIIAGRKAEIETQMDGVAAGCSHDAMTTNRMTSIYRAMRKLEPAAPAPIKHQRTKFNTPAQYFHYFSENERSGEDRRERQHHDTVGSFECRCLGTNRRKSQRRAP